MQNRTFLVLLRPIFGEKLKTAPPPKEIGCRSCEVHVVLWPEKAFEFPILAEKSVSILVKTFFYFWRTPVFGLKKRLNFRAFREIPSQFSDNPCDSDSRTMKIRVKVVCTFSHSFKKAPPFSKSWLLAWLQAKMRIVLYYLMASHCNPMAFNLRIPSFIVAFLRVHRRVVH